MKLVETTKQIETKINKILSKQVVEFIRKRQSRLTSRVQDYVAKTIEKSPEIQSLRSGELKIDFGLDSDPTDQIVNTIANSVRVLINPVKFSKGSFVAGVEVLVQPTSFANLLSADFAEQEIRGGSIPWLEWLLTRGDSIIIADFGVEYQSGRGRSGGGTMSSTVAPFKVNPRYSGTTDNNFITRALDRSQQELIKIIQQELS